MSRVHGQYPTVQKHRLIPREVWFPTAMMRYPQLERWQASWWPESAITTHTYGNQAVPFYPFVKGWDAMGRGKIERQALSSRCTSFTTELFTSCTALLPSTPNSNTQAAGRCLVTSNMTSWIGLSRIGASVSPTRRLHAQSFSALLRFPPRRDEDL